MIIFNGGDDDHFDCDDLDYGAFDVDVDVEMRCWCLLC
jgi:hypothetical protein